MYHFFNTVQHQASEAAVNNIAECSEINANENCNSETEKEIVTVISSSTIVEASVTEKKDIEWVNNAEDVVVSEANQSESERIQEKSIAETETQSSVSTISASTSCQRWSRGHKARGQGQGHKKNPRPRPRTAFPRTDTLEAKDRNARGQGQGPRTQSASALQKKKKKRSSQKFFRRSPLKNVFQKIFQAFHKILTFQKIVLSSSRGQANFRGLEASRPRPRT